MSKRVNKERICCLVGFYEEIIAVFLRKISQIDTQNEEKPKIFKFSLFLCCFCQINVKTPTQRKDSSFQWAFVER